MSSRASTPNRNVKVLAALSPASSRLQQQQQQAMQMQLQAMSPINGAQAANGGGGNGGGEGGSMITEQQFSHHAQIQQPMSAAVTLETLGVAIGDLSLSTAGEGDEGLSAEDVADSLAMRLKQIDPEKLIQAGILPPVEPGWACKRCTFWNREGALACEVCTASPGGEIEEGALVR